MTLLAALVLAPLTLLTFCFAVELVVGLVPIRARVRSKPGATAIIIVPAHDEEVGIAAMLTELIAAALDRAKILVVADNCTDRTAELARHPAVEIIERDDPERRGKGFALDFARAHLRQDPPGAIVVLDADCRIDGESLDNLLAVCVETNRPCQAVNLQFPGAGASPAVQLSTFALFIKNVVRQRALQRLAGRAHLFGTGMAFPWSVFERAPLATDNIVEDLQIGIELAEAGAAPLFVEQAIVWSAPETEANTLVQRRRWEGGFLRSTFRLAPAVFGRSIRAGDLRGIWAALNLLIPPLALLVLLDLGLLLLGGALIWLLGAKAWPVIALAICLLLAGLGLAGAWASGGRRFVTLVGLAQIPFYILWKLPMYLTFARRGAPKEWIRTR